MSLSMCKKERKGILGLHSKKEDERGKVRRERGERTSVIPAEKGLPP
jgi:hypothetical protein